MEKAIKKIGVLTGGGDCPGLNAVIRAVVKTAIHKYNLKVVGIKDGFRGLVENDMDEMNWASTRGILPRGGTILGTTNRDNPFKYAVGEKNGQTIFEDRSDQAIANMKKHDIDALVIIGGDGSLSIGYEFTQKGVPVVGVPKTIDNDLSATDVTFGFDTAINTATEALDRLHTTAESHHRVMIMEVMGRYAGWIALEAGLAGGANVILVPEIPFSIEKVCAHIKERSQKDCRHSIVVVAEGAKVGGEFVVRQTVKESHDPLRLGGVANLVGQKIQEGTGIETRVTILGHIQRGGSPTAFDRILGTRLGAAAVDAIMEGKHGCMVSLRTPNIETVPLDSAIKVMKKVEPGCQLVKAAKAIGISFGD